MTSSSQILKVFTRPSLDTMTAYTPVKIRSNIREIQKRGDEVSQGVAKKAAPAPSKSERQLVRQPASSLNGGWRQMIDCLPDIVTEHPAYEGTAHTTHKTESG